LVFIPKWPKEVVKKYIREQEQEDERLDYLHLELKDEEE